MNDELAFLERTLGAPVVRSPTLQVLWRGYGEVYRVTAAGRTAIVKSVRPPAGNDRAHQRKCRSYDVELAWYRHWAPRCPARVPSLLGFEHHGESWLFVLEDLDAAGFAGRARRPDRAQLDQVLRWLARFHAHHMDREPIGLWERGTYWDLEKPPDELRALTDGKLRARAPLLDAQLRGCPFQTIVHGDAKPANFCFGRVQGVAAVDFQWVGRGVGVSDVAYLLDGATDQLDAYLGHLHELLDPEIAGEVVDAWRALYPVAVADFERFYAGWS